MMGIKIIETKKVIGYETVQNGREYAKIQGIDYTFHKTDYIHQRVDSAGNVFVYYPNINTENLLYKFNVCVGDTWPNQAGVMWRVEEKSILDNKIYLTFRWMSSMPFSTCSITEGIGLVGYSYEGGGAGLVGSCINGIVKGDTTINTAVDDIMEIKPRESLLEQNYPNPFNPSTEISYTIPEKVRVRIEIYSPAGRKIRTLLDRDRPAGEYTAVWDGSDDSGRRVGSGIYVCRMSAGRFVKTIKMVVAR
jgi:hypothetical protein